MTELKDVLLKRILLDRSDIIGKEDNQNNKFINSLSHIIKMDNIKEAYTEEDSLLVLQTTEENDTYKFNSQKKDKDIEEILHGFFGKSTRDGKIDPTQQHATNDCWLLSAVNALSYTEEGRQIIKDALEYHTGYTIVHLKGIGDIKVFNSEVNETKKSDQYSSGDDDMIIFELAIEKALDMIANGDIKLDRPLDDDANKRTGTTEGKSSTEYGYIKDALYYITGIDGHHVFGKSNMNAVLDEFQNNNGQDMVLGFSINPEGEDAKPIYVKDIYGVEHKLGTRHAYAVKKVTDDTVTITNPWDSGKDIVLPRETFLNLNGYLDVCDLSQKEVNLVMTPQIDKKGNKIYERSCSPQEVSDYLGDSNKCVKEITKYSKNGRLLEAKYLDEDGNVVFLRKYDKNGNVIKTYSFNKDNEVGLSVSYDKEGNIKDVQLYNIYGGNLEDDSNSKITFFNKKYQQLIFKRNLFDYPQFSANDIYDLMFMPENEWQIAKMVLKYNPDASMKDIRRAIENDNSFIQKPTFGKDGFISDPTDDDKFKKIQKDKTKSIAPEYTSLDNDSNFNSSDDDEIEEIDESEFKKILNKKQGNSILEKFNKKYISKK